MDPYITGKTIRALREKNHMTQAALAEKLSVSDKAVSKWETGKGYPDITLLEPLSKAFGVSAAELLSGSTVTNTNRAANMLHTQFYVCPVCGNVIHAVGPAVITCHGITLPPLTAEEPDDRHAVTVTPVEDEYFVSVEHEMTCTHYISFLAAVSPDRVQLVKLYPEGSAQARFKRTCIKRIYFYCSKDGLFEVKV